MTGGDKAYIGVMDIANPSGPSIAWVSANKNTESFVCPDAGVYIVFVAIDTTSEAPGFASYCDFYRRDANRRRHGD